MDIRQIQEENRIWADRNFPNANIWEPLLGVSEEVGELHHAFLKHHQGIRLEENHLAKMEDAVGDIVIYLMDFCNRSGLDLQDCIERAWTEVKDRDWNHHRQEIGGN